MSEKDYGIRASQMAPSQMEAVRRMEADLAALRARVRELEGALLTPDETAAVRAFWEYGATRGNHPDGGGAGPGPLTGWINSMGDAVRKLTARALLPAPAPGRDTNNGGTDAA